MQDIEHIHILAQNKKIRFTEHAIQRFTKRRIDIITDLVPALLNSEIVECYPDDYPYKSYLILGTTVNKKYLHIVCAIGNDELWIITAYFPDINEWEKDFKTRKK